MTSQYAHSLYLVLLAILVQVMTSHSSEAADSRTLEDPGPRSSWTHQTSHTKENRSQTKLENTLDVKLKLTNFIHFSVIHRDNNISRDNNTYILPVEYDGRGSNKKGVKFSPVSFILPESDDALHKSETMRHWNFVSEPPERRKKLYISGDNRLKKSENVHNVLGHGRVKRYIQPKGSDNENCARFEVPETNPTNTLYTLYSPGEAGGNYTRNIKCEIVLTAESGKLLELDFRNSFYLELSENCTYDYLEVRDGAYGYSGELGRYCGSKFPPPIRSTGRHLWLHFNSDDNIEYSGFTAVIKAVDRPTNGTLPPETNDCYEEMGDDEGFVQSSTVPAEFIQFAKEHQTHLDCLWKITVRPDWKINVNFTFFDLTFPNERNKNYVDVFDNDTSIAQKKGNFCGSIAEPVTTVSNILFIHFYADHVALGSKFEVLYTAFRDLTNKQGQACVAGEEFDCTDATCIAISLQCNGRNNCKHKNDEADCKDEQKSPLATTHIVVIVVVFALILSGMLIVFIFKCVRKLMSDHKLIDEHLRQSREGQLDEVGVCEAAEVAKQARAESLASLASASANVNNNNTRHNNRRNESLDRRRLRHLTSFEDARESGDTELLHSERIDFERLQRAERSRQDQIDNAERLDHLDRMDHVEQKDLVDKKDRMTRTNQMDQRSRDAQSDYMDSRHQTPRSNRLARSDRVDHAVQIDADDRLSRDRLCDMQDEECQTRESLFEQPPLVPSHSTSFGNSEGSSSGSVAAGGGGDAFSTFGYGGGGKGTGCSESTLRRVGSPPAPAPAARAYRAEAVVRLKAAAGPAAKYKEDSRPVSCTTTRSAPDVIIVTKLPGH